jgi:hypothetical protein
MLQLLGGDWVEKTGETPSADFLDFRSYVTKPRERALPFRLAAHVSVSEENRKLKQVVTDLTLSR